MNRYVVVVAILGVLTFLFHFAGAFAPSTVLLLGVALVVIGDRLSHTSGWSLSSPGPKPGTGETVIIYGLLAVTAGVAGLPLYGNPWLVVFPGVLIGIISFLIERQDAWPKDKVRLSDLGRVVVAIGLPVVGLSIATELDMNLVTGSLVIGIGSVIGYLVAPRSFVRLRQCAKYDTTV